MRWRGCLRSFTLLGLLLCLSCGPARGGELSPAGNPLVLLRLNQTVVRAEVVFTPDKLYLGLGGRKELPWGQGMLFLLPTFEVQEFCMRGMLIPIDIIWLAGDRVIGFHQRVSPQETGDLRSPGPADAVLEVPAGFVAAAGVRVGDRLVRL